MGVTFPVETEMDTEGLQVTMAVKQPAMLGNALTVAEKVQLFRSTRRLNADRSAQFVYTGAWK